MTDISSEDLLAAADAVVKAGRASTPVLREQLGVGYTRANTLLGALEAHHIIGASDGVHAREVLVPDWTTWEQVRLEYFDRDDAGRQSVWANHMLDELEATTAADLADDDDDGPSDADLSLDEDDGEGDEHFDDVVSVDVTRVGGQYRTFVTIHAGQLARVLAEAAKFCDLSEGSEPRCWIEVSVSGGWLHAMAFNGIAAGWSRAPLFDPDEMPAHYVHNGGAAAQLASAMIHADDAKALARVVKHRGKANEFDRATLIFDPDAGTLYVERVDVEDQRDVRITLTDYRGTTLAQDASGDPMGWMRVDEFARRFQPDDGPIGAVRIHPSVLALFSGLLDPFDQGLRFTLGRQHTAHGGRPLLVRIASSFTGYVQSLDPNIEGDTGPSVSYQPFDAADPVERDYVRPEVAS